MAHYLLLTESVYYLPYSINYHASFLPTVGVQVQNFVLSLIVSMVVCSPAVSEGLVENGTCELVVASRQSLSEARSYIQEVDDNRFAKIFRSSNGWYAISIGSLKPHEEAPIMDAWKSAGKIPNDAICSSGKNYVAMYNWRSGKEVTKSVSREVTTSSSKNRSSRSLKVGDIVKFNGKTERLYLYYYNQGKITKSREKYFQDVVFKIKKFEGSNNQFARVYGLERSNHETYLVRAQDIRGDLDFSHMVRNKYANEFGVAGLMADNGALNRPLTRAQSKQLKELASVFGNRRHPDLPKRIIRPYEYCGKVKPLQLPASPKHKCDGKTVEALQAKCVLAGASEFVCGEIMEAEDVRPSTGAKNSALCSALIQAVNDGQITTIGIVESSVFGALDNYGETTGGNAGDFIRLMAGLGKYAAVRRCQNKVSLACDPSPLVRKHEQWKAKVADCRDAVAAVERVEMLQRWTP
ncbi:hypothetical protein [uncultured Sulfitobacter sp.]|uniref:hypothetical protein n=1 Tax=uncultured Sulfitobacter sp. TaxID=191468 RepID=UPI002625B4B5|nr:hypothetical protein [uncultured Sulfitobacter sp.]